MIIHIYSRLVLSEIWRKSFHTWVLFVLWSHGDVVGGYKQQLTVEGKKRWTARTKIQISFRNEFKLWQEKMWVRPFPFVFLLSILAFGKVALPKRVKWSHSSKTGGLETSAFYVCFLPKKWTVSKFCNGFVLMDKEEKKNWLNKVLNVFACHWVRYLISFNPATTDCVPMWCTANQSIDQLMILLM